VAKRPFILLILLLAVYIVAFISSNVYALPLKEAGVINAEQVHLSNSQKKEKPTTLSGAHSIKKCKYRTRIWTQFFLFDAPQQPGICINSYFLLLKQTGYYSALLPGEVNDHSSLRGPPVFI
jgi:hypothetical protein